MHILTQAIEPTVVVGSYAASAAALANVASRARPHVSPARVGTVAALAGGILVAQAANFPVPGGTAHVLGVGIAVALVGPRVTAVLMAGILAIQALVLGDGSFEALGLNVINMALVAVGAAWLAHRAVTLASTSLAASHRKVVAACAAGWAALAAGQLGVAVESMLGWASAPADLVSTIEGHGLTVAAELLVTAAVFAAVGAIAGRRSVSSKEHVLVDAS